MLCHSVSEKKLAGRTRSQGGDVEAKWPRVKNDLPAETENRRVKEEEVTLFGEGGTAYESGEKQSLAVTKES